MTESDDRQRRRLLKMLCAAAAGSALPLSGMAATRLDNFKLVHHDNLHLYFDLDGTPSSANLFALNNPERLVIDLADTANADLRRP